MKAIETTYKGYRFRSRLEARWAVFFDALGVKWEYEPQGYEFDDGMRYLPDFRLPSFLGGECDCYVEIKHANTQESDWVKAKRFAVEHPVLLLAGVPSAVRVDTLYIPSEGKVHEFFVHFTPKDLVPCVKWHGSRCCDHCLERKVSPSIKHAVAMARGARFEFGECGAFA